jgi:putative DNA primase/helicase
LLAAPPLTEGVVALYTKEQTVPNKRLLSVRVESIPKELRIRPQWVVWRAVGDKPNKVPYSARTGRKASSTDLTTWSTFEEALEAYEHNQYTGLGFVFSSGDPYVGVDLDGCRDSRTGEIEVWATEIIEALNSYTELSPSGEGVHIIARGKIPSPLKRDLLEMYGTERFFTVTGHVLERHAA